MEGKEITAEDQHVFFEQFTLGKELGKGHFATVNLVTRKEDGVKFACKILLQKHVGKSNKEVVMKEINIMQSVGSHPGCVNLIEFFKDKENYYIVMEYCGGGDLFGKIINDGAFSEEVGVKYMRQLAQGIQHIHKAGVAHRDIKPENILITEAGDLKLADFGLSKMVDEKQLMKTQCGTWAYCAPEVLQKKAYSLAVDVWSLGVLMYILLCGYHPFDECGDSPEHILQRRIIKVKYDFNDPNWEKVSQDAKDTIKAMLVYDPAERLSIDSFLASPWIVGKGHTTHELSHVGRGLAKHVQGKSKFKGAILATLAANKFRSVTTTESNGAENSQRENSLSKT